MKKQLPNFFLAMAITAGSQNALSLSPEHVFAKASPSVVMVFAVADRSRKSISQGSGVSVGGDKVITNCHVVLSKKGSPSEEIVVYQGGRKSIAHVLAKNNEYDTCLLGVSELNIPAVSIADTKNLRVGQRVYAIGAPSGLDLTLTDGLLSAIRKKGKSRVIQTSAAISPGSSGGGLFDEDGNLIGITSFTLESGTNLNFAYMTDAIFGLVRLSLSVADERQVMSSSVQAALPATAANRPPPSSSFSSQMEAVEWLAEMSPRLEKRIPNRDYRNDLLRSVHYEAIRAGLDPQLVLGLIDVVSEFRKFYVSPTDGRGYMSVRPEWISLIGRPDDSLFDLRTNLRYGCTILRHYLDAEGGDLFRALIKYDLAMKKGPGSDMESDTPPRFPNLVTERWNGNWSYKKN